MVLIQLNLAVQWLAYLALCDEVYNSFGNSHVSGQSTTYLQTTVRVHQKKVSWAGVVGCGFVFLTKLIMHLRLENKSMFLVSWI